MRAERDQRKPESKQNQHFIENRIYNRQHLHFPSYSDFLQSWVSKELHGMAHLVKLTGLYPNTLYP